MQTTASDRTGHIEAAGAWTRKVMGPASPLRELNGRPPAAASRKRKRPANGCGESEAAENRVRARAKTEPPREYRCTYAQCSFAYTGDISLLYKHVVSCHAEGPGLYTGNLAGVSSTTSVLDKLRGAGKSRGGASGGLPSPVDRIKAEAQRGLSPARDTRACARRSWMTRTRAAGRGKSKLRRSECEGNRFITNDQL
ncbi:uncharacterized protein AMSG_06017 [Thecamonas trahens ATCC 50062]|uniref:Uncharacterized protein n=1 Tax=Thecamonas trahens ATCC 50062 TaxID=461836 RepID=A0A0L0DBX8_THETB|nr:hypothetical protein AMSG_06017 [Thecamonas trahens ATCC 50062]KNC49745.1 hypothetical protein AMSG_06017 [Thecamonas trahens ATCC 50062]|eukprot:XP_013757532.1 hypothetical protein AMSG_06017 [Thecamonas trahens ATCC 50062]